MKIKNEACSREMMFARIGKAPELFLVAEDRHTGKIAGFLNGISTDEYSFRDEFFSDADLHDPNGRNIMLLGLSIPEEFFGNCTRILMRRLKLLVKKRSTCMENYKVEWRRIILCMKKRLEEWMDRNVNISQIWMGSSLYSSMIYGLRESGKNGKILRNI